ncbi:MAG: hypothetical protein KDB21_20705, partial [Acidimicrobiales bacterium]|nr:hypothetical protein [Acidimicrobiales bacterium]
SRRLRDLRALGFAPVQAIFDAVLPGGPIIAPPGLVIRFLGEPTVLVDGIELPTSAWKSKKALEVLRYLAVRDGWVGREQVIEAVWPERSPAQGRTLLRSALSEIRRVLEPGRTPGEPSRFVTTERTRVAVAAATDLGEAEAAMGRSDHATAFSVLVMGLGELGSVGEWGEELARHVDRRRLEAAERVATDAASPQRREALELLTDLEPWQREHVDALAALHRSVGDEAAARAVERRWFDDE